MSAISARIDRAHRNPPSGLARGQTKGAEDALKIVVAIIFNLDASPFFAVVHQYAGTQVFLQSILQIFDRCRGGGIRRRLTPVPRTSPAKLPCHQALRGT